MTIEIIIPLSLVTDWFLQLDFTLQVSFVIGMIGAALMAAGIMKKPSFETGLFVFYLGAVFVLIAVVLGTFGSIILNGLPISFKVI